MKKNGFTLVELLGVISLLAIILLIGSISVTKSIKEGKEQMYKVDMENYIISLKTWALDNTSLLPKNNNSLAITLSTLEKEGYVKGDKINPLTNKKYDSKMLFCIYNVNNTYRYEISKDNKC